jgi:cystathionine beta-lyase
MCSPHNPVARVWSREELLKIGQICLRRGVKVISDEIHCDLVLPPNKHHIFASLAPEFEDICVTCTAPSKTFNVPGLQAAHMFVKNPQLKAAITADLNKTPYHHLNLMGMIAAEAAYTHGGPWLDALLLYLKANADYLRAELQNTGGKIKLIEPQGTYLMWLDCRALGLTDDKLDDFFTHKAGLWLNRGDGFGAGGSGFMRMNIACPRAALERALKQLKEALPHA